MRLSNYDQKYVRIETIYGDVFSGFARYENRDFLESEWGGNEDGVFIEDFLIYNSQIASIEEIVPHGTAEIWTEQLILRRCRPGDAKDLRESLGTDPEAFPYEERNPFDSAEAAWATVRRTVGRYDDPHFYSWVMEIEDVVVGTIAARGGGDGGIEVSFNVVRGWRRRGLAAEALKKVLEYLTVNEGFPRVTARCAAEDVRAQKVLEASGMRPARAERSGLTYEYPADAGAALP